LTKVMDNDLPTSGSRPTCVIRTATAGDAPAIEALYRELVSDPLIRVEPEQVEALSRSSTSFLLVAESGGGVLATALQTLCPDAMYRRQPFGVVENVVVSRQSRGQGIGRNLFAHVEHLAVTHECTKLMLLSSAARPEAHAFFSSCGFTSDAKLGFVKYRRNFSVR
jgi:N-acetylglutamate synthase-like GNAT family acetyltransferase